MMNLPMKISIVTVCYNMEKTIEETILSVLNQHYPNLEYIIVDGGSTDGTMEIVDRYRKQLATVISEPDNGMYDALRKGFNVSSGEVLAWINADDEYLPWTFKFVNEVFSQFSDVNWIGGIPMFMDENRVVTDCFPCPGSKKQKEIAKGCYQTRMYGCLQQEGMFWRRSLYELSGGLDLNYRYAGDFDLWCKFAKFSELYQVSIPLGVFMRRKDSLSIGGNDKYDAEVKQISNRLGFSYNIFYRIASKSRVLINLLRLITFRRAPIICYSVLKSQWQVTRMIRSVSYHTLLSLRINH